MRRQLAARDAEHGRERHYTYDNVGRVHQTLGTTPAMQASIADHTWSHEVIAELLDRRPKL